MFYKCWKYSSYWPKKVRCQCQNVHQLFHGHFLHTVITKERLPCFIVVLMLVLAKACLYVSFVRWFKHECCEDLMKRFLFLVFFFSFPSMMFAQMYVATNLQLRKTKRFLLVCSYLWHIWCSVIYEAWFTFFSAWSLLHSLECRFVIFNDACTWS